MDFHAGPEQQALIDSAVRLLQDHYSQTTSNARTEFDAERWQQFAELGWLGTALAEGNGGLGLSESMLNILVEALAPAAMPEPFVSQVSLAGYLLNSASPSARRDECMAKWLAGDELVALAHHEAREQACFGQPVHTRATARGDELVVQGHKAVVLDGGRADRLLVSARLNDSAAMLLLLVPQDAPGFEVTRYATFDGRELADVDLNGVVLSRDARLEFAEPVATRIDAALRSFALHLAADSLGTAKALFKLSHEHLAERAQFGVKLVEFQALQHRLVDMQLAITRLESLLALARTRIDADGVSSAREFIAAAKIQAGVVGRHLAHESVQLHGASGMTEELLVGRYFKRLTANELLGGTGVEHLRVFRAQRALS